MKKNKGAFILLAFAASVLYMYFKVGFELTVVWSFVAIMAAILNK